MADKVTRCIKVDPQLWRELKLTAVKQNRNISDIVEDLIRSYLKEVRE